MAGNALRPPAGMFTNVAVPPETPYLILVLVMAVAVTAVLRVIAGEFRRAVAWRDLTIRAWELREEQTARMIERLKECAPPAPRSDHGVQEMDADAPLSINVDDSGASAPPITQPAARAA